MLICDSLLSHSYPSFNLKTLASEIVKKKKYVCIFNEMPRIEFEFYNAIFCKTVLVYGTRQQA